jgi:16S rRNA (adenine1518-N6/adenine1519-N6)-dimethyltransferase
MHFMLQKEVVDRLAAQPGTKTYGRLSVIAQMLCKVESLFDVGPGAFRPPPKVWSSVVRMTPRSTPLIALDRVTEMEQLTQLLFSQRRKTLRRILSHRLTADQMQAIGIDAMRRPETLALEEFIKLAAILGASA